MLPTPAALPQAWEDRKSSWNMSFLTWLQLCITSPNVGLGSVAGLGSLLENVLLIMQHVITKEQPGPKPSMERPCNLPCSVPPLHPTLLPVWVRDYPSTEWIG